MTLTPNKFKIDLSIGNANLRIIGDLDRNYPSNCRLEYQDIETPWKEYKESNGKALQAFCNLFQFIE